MKKIISRKIHIVNECIHFGNQLAPNSQELPYQFSEAVMYVESLLGDDFSDCYLFMLTIEIEKILTSDCPFFLSKSDMARVEVLLVLINYLKVVNGNGAIGVDFSGGLSSLLDNKHTRCILDDINDELVKAYLRGNLDVQKISTLISDIAIYEPEAAERLRDIIDICIMEVFDDLKK
tara:strand:- start:11289 stop:11819 length:531 start_codon:yes stop_codon:yes gene_type:complete